MFVQQLAQVYVGTMEDLTRHNGPSSREIFIFMYMCMYAVDIGIFTKRKLSKTYVLQHFN